MNLLPKSAWRYALMMVALLGVVAWAAFSIISHMDERLADVRHADTIRELSVAVWSLTMGVMFLTGAFGMWAIRSTVEIEGRRRIGRFVAAMDYLSDGLMLLDKNGVITGYNPALRQLAPVPDAGDDNLSLVQFFPCLDRADVDLLLDLACTREFERDCVYPGGVRTLRFRSQPSSGVRLVLVSDVTDMRSHEIRRRQIALLQLVGRIAGGVAHDFNNILCAISGHAALMARGGMPAPAVADSLDVIQKETQKGALLSRQLLALSRAGVTGRNVTRIEKHLDEAAALLRIGLTPAWTVKTEADGDFPPAPLTAGQIEQIILNLGLLAADAQAQPGVLTITLARPGTGNLTNIPAGYGSVLLISAEAAADGGRVDAVPSLAMSSVLADEGGVILSVVKSLVEEARGILDHLSAKSGACIYRVCLPHLDIPAAPGAGDADCPAEIGDYLAGWRVALAFAPPHEPAAIEGALRDVGVSIRRHDSFVALLSATEDLQKQDAVILDERLLGDEMEGLLRTILKLCPRVGVLVMCAAPESAVRELKFSVAFAGYTEPAGRLMQMLIIAKALRVSGAALTNAGIATQKS